MTPFRSLVTALLFAATFAAHAQAESATKAPVTAAQRQGEAAMMKECLARELKKSGVDTRMALVACRAQQEAHREQSSAPNSDQRPASGMDGKSAAGHSSHSGVEQSQATSAPPLASPQPAGKQPPSSEAK